MSPEAERLRWLADGCEISGLEHLPVVARANAAPFAADVRAVLANLSKVMEENARLREALEPFADFGDFMESETEGFADLDRMNLTPEESECVLGNLSVGAFRRARSLLSREG